MPQRRLTPSDLEARRREAIAAIEKGASQTAAAAMVGASRTSVNNWVRRFRDEGPAGLQARPTGRPTVWQAGSVTPSEARAWLLENAPEGGGLWTWQRIQQLLRTSAVAQVSRWTVRRYLADWRMEPPRPLGALEAASPGRVLSWFAHEYKNVKAHAQKQGQSVWFVEDTQVSAGARTTTVHWVVGPRGEWSFVTDESTQRTRGTSMFLEHVLEHFDGSLLLVASDPSAYRTRPVRDWLASRHERLELEVAGA